MPEARPPAARAPASARRSQRPRSDAAYRRSRAARLPATPPPPAAASLARSLLDATTLLERERLGSALVDVLDLAFGLPPCALVVADRPQLHRRDGGGRLTRRTYGTYRCRLGAPGELPRGCRIRIYHRTAVRGQVLAPRPFLHTLLHEWVHHLDFAGLQLDRSPHTLGFTARLQQLAAALRVAAVLPPPAEPPGGADAVR